MKLILISTLVEVVVEVEEKLRIGLKLSTVGAWALLSLTIYLYKFAKLMAKRVKICRFRYRYSEIYTPLSPILTIPEHILKFMSLKL